MAAECADGYRNGTFAQSGRLAGTGRWRDDQRPMVASRSVRNRGEATAPPVGQPLGVSGQLTPDGWSGRLWLVGPSENGVVTGSTGSLWQRAQNTGWWQ